MSAALGTRSAQADSDPVVTRPEVRELTSVQWERFVAAVKKMHVGDDVYSRMVLPHYNNASAAHGRAAFLPWHRLYLSRFEKNLQLIDPRVVLPYWDWSRDAAAPERSPVLSAAYFGGTGRPQDGVVVGGAFANWQCAVPKRHSLRRSGKKTIPSFYSPEALEHLLATATSYDGLRQLLEGSPHGNVHVGIGGNSGDMSYMYAPNDPLFWVVECFIDLLWAEWQQRNPGLARTYGGGGAKPSDVLPPFGVPVSRTLDTTTLGYTYPRWSADRAAH
ncbi:tyrosinase family protein [Streptomyces antibioticus]|uniref:tyrosinase family protein n=1 Tax=Streptomyces antibioticus TaxID=1890 RepID=UPI0036B1373B